MLPKLSRCTFERQLIPLRAIQNASTRSASAAGMHRTQFAAGLHRIFFPCGGGNSRLGGVVSVSGGVHGAGTPMVWTAGMSGDCGDAGISHQRRRQGAAAMVARAVCSMSTEHGVRAALLWPLSLLFAPLHPPTAYLLDDAGETQVPNPL